MGMFRKRVQNPYNNCTLKAKDIKRSNHEMDLRPQQTDPDFPHLDAIV